LFTGLDLLSDENQPMRQFDPDGWFCCLAQPASFWARVSD